MALSTAQRNIAQVFQFPVIYDTMTVGENSPSRSRTAACRGRDRGARARDRPAARPGALSGAQGNRLTADAKQKISLGRGLVRADVAAILFDEPLTVIDPGLKWELRSKLKVLHRALDLTMIYVTHDQTEALTFADTVVVMHEGSVVQTGTPDELFLRPAHTFVGYFIGSPGMNVLPAEVRAARRGSPATHWPRAELRRAAGGRAHRNRHPPRIRAHRSAGARPAGGRVERIDDLGRGRFARVARRRPQDGGRACPRASRPPAMRRRLVFDPAQIHVYADSAGRGDGVMEKTVNQKAWLLVLPVFALVAFSAVIPLMTVVNYSVQDTFGNNQFFWNGVGWYQELLDPRPSWAAASSPRCGATSPSPRSC